ncbi:MAG: chalcone isomerase family protein, partial [Alphaproteobacteria bacterium]|nr:chalcone isomerase family protein [Alphaproteobacteria bacterium]MDE1902193.1 chalcone isomerase family protein [Alphaproteobacteria bacterium]
MIGFVSPGAETLLYFNGKQIGEIKDPALTSAFFNIWLGAGADEDLKNELLGQPG